MSYTHTDLDGAVPADARARGLLPDRLGRQRPRDRAPRAELLRRAVRPVAAPRPGVRRVALERPETISRSPSLAANFIELCARLTGEDEKAFEDLFRLLGLSVDWTQTYTTIGERLAPGVAASVPAAAREGRRLHGGGAHDVGRGLQDRRRAGRDRGSRAGGPIPPDRVRLGDAGRRSRSRRRGPELIPACVALVAHPDDERYAPLVGTTVLTPLFGVPVPVVAHELADPEKGTGIAMICTFGDLTDVTWWRELRLPLRVVVGTRRQDRAPHVRRARVGVDRARRQRTPRWRELAGLRAKTGARAGSSSCSRGRRCPARRAPAGDRHVGEVLREGGTAARDHHEPAVVRRHLAVQGAACSRVARSSGGTRPTWARAIARGSRT